MPNIIYLDDEVELTHIFKLFFQDSDHNVLTFTDEDAALSHCQQHCPDIVFIDYRLSNMRGDEVAVRLPKEVRKVLVTGDITVENEFLFDAIIKKPFRLAELLSIVDELL